MRRAIQYFVAAAALAFGASLLAQTSVPDIAFDSSVDFLKPPDNIHLGEVAGVATNSRGHIFVYTRTGHPYGTLGDSRTFYHGGSRLFEFDQTGKFVKEIGQGLYGFNAAQGLRIDPQDNIWIMDAGANQVIKFDADGRTTPLILGRKGEAISVRPGAAGGGGGGGAPGGGGARGGEPATTSAAPGAPAPGAPGGARGAGGGGGAPGGGGAAAGGGGRGAGGGAAAGGGGRGAGGGAAAGGGGRGAGGGAAAAGAPQVAAPPAAAAGGGGGRGGGRGAPGAGAAASAFSRPTDVTWDRAGNIYVADGIGNNNRIGKYDKDGKFLKSWGQTGSEQGQFNGVRGIATDAQGNLYVADAGNKRIEVFDNEGNFKSQITNIGTPMAICISRGPTQYIYSSHSGDTDGMADAVIYKVQLDGRVVGKFGSAGKLPKQFGLVNSIDCRTENELLVGEMTNWRVQKITLRAAK